MTDEEKIVRLSAILGVEGAVQYGAYRGYGERSHKKGHREARLGGNAGDGSDDAAALRSLVCRMERSAEYEPKRMAYVIAQVRSQAKDARASEARSRAEAERCESHANDCEREAATVAAKFCAYRADCGTEDES